MHVRTVFKLSSVTIPTGFTAFKRMSSNYASLAGKRVLVTGAAGQVGTELVPYLERACGQGNVIASDIKLPRELSKFPFCYLDVTNEQMVARVVTEQRVDVIVHLASILSAMGEQNPQLALKINIQGSENLLNIALRNNLKVFIPSTIAAFGPSTPKDDTPDLTIMRPTTVYGISKVYVELLGCGLSLKCRHVVLVSACRLSVPVAESTTTAGTAWTSVVCATQVLFRTLHRQARLFWLGLCDVAGQLQLGTSLSVFGLAGGGTTDYAVAIYYEALQTGKYTSFLSENSALPMMYMPDCLKATIVSLPLFLPLLVYSPMDPRSCAGFNRC
jgi:threonine 3-dehydrogenase